MRFTETPSIITLGETHHAFTDRAGLVNVDFLTQHWPEAADFFAVKTK
jgi:hypothetical protein